MALPIMAAKESGQLYGFFGMLWRLALAGLLILCMAAGGGYLLAERLIQKPETETPDLLSLNLDSAVKKASKEGFSVFVAKTEATDLLKPGLVLSQRPSPGASAKAGAAIHVTVAAKP